MARKTLSVLILSVFCVFLMYQFLPHDHQTPGDHISISHGDHHHHPSGHHHHDSKEPSRGLLGFLMENHGHSYHADCLPQLIKNASPQTKIKDLPSDDFLISGDFLVSCVVTVAPPGGMVSPHFNKVLAYTLSQRGPPLTC